MKFFLILFLLSVNIFAQTDLIKLVETEKTFSKTATEKGTKSAFLEFLADDGVIFHPNRVNGKESWKNRPDSPSVLTWTPEFAEISANGVIGYTTGPWEFRPDGKNSLPTAFGHFVTIWQNSRMAILRSFWILASHTKSCANVAWNPSAPIKVRKKIVCR